MTTKETKWNFMVKSSNDFHTKHKKCNTSSVRQHFSSAFDNMYIDFLYTYDK